jgi:proteasome accessory factor C
MARIDSAHRLHRLLTRKHQPPLALSRICQELECSEKTARRTIDDLRDRYGHPLVYDREFRGWRYDGDPKNEIPGLWFNQSELMALLTMQRLLEQTQPGLLEKDLAPIGDRVRKLVDANGLGTNESMTRVRIVAMAGRTVDDRVFGICSDAVLTRRQLEFSYAARGRQGESETRNVSPQRLTHYRDNWYLDGWCHAREGLRIFSLDEIRDLRLLDVTAIDIDEQTLNDEFKSSYGIFSGTSKQRAVLRFNAHRARWVSKEIWHPDQEGRFLDDGTWELEVPYGHPAELVMDILKYGPDVEVTGPAELRQLVAERVNETANTYGRGAA